MNGLLHALPVSSRAARAALVASLFVGPGLAMAQPQQHGTTTEKGSLVIYPDVEVRWNEDGSAVIQDTFLHLTNDYPAAVDVKLFFVNGDEAIASPARWDGNDPADLIDALLEGRIEEIFGRSDATPGEVGDTEYLGGDRGHPGWNFFDNIIHLTANEPAYWSVATGLPKGVAPFQTLDPGPPPGRPDPDDVTQRYLRGFVIAFAIRQVPTADEIRWNHLSGEATIVNYREENAWQYAAVQFQANTDDFPVNGQATGTPGVLSLDGTEYAPYYESIRLNFVPSEATTYSGAGVPIVHDTRLTLLPLSFDLRQERDDPVITNAIFTIYNRGGTPFTGLQQCVQCWSSRLVSSYGDFFKQITLGSNSGRARIHPRELGCGGLAEAVPLLGVAAKRLAPALGAAPERIAGYNLTGADETLGSQNGIVRYDTADPPPESNSRPEGSINP